MREFTPNIKRNIGELFFENSDPPATSRKFDTYDQIRLSEVADGEHFIDREYNRPLVKLDGVLRQMKIDSNGYVFYDSPSNDKYSGTLTNAISNIVFPTPPEDSNKTFYLPVTFGVTNVSTGSKSIGIVPEGYTLKQIFIKIKTAFVGMTDITMEIVETISTVPTVIVPQGDIDLTTVGQIVIPCLRELIASDTSYSINFYGTPMVSPYRAYLIMEFIKVDYV